MQLLLFHPKWEVGPLPDERSILFFLGSFNFTEIRIQSEVLAQAMEKKPDVFSESHSLKLSLINNNIVKSISSKSIFE